MGGTLAAMLNRKLFPTSEIYLNMYNFVNCDYDLEFLQAQNGSHATQTTFCLLLDFLTFSVLLFFVSSFSYQ